MNPRGRRVTQNAYFSLLTHTKQLLVVTFCDPTAGFGASFQTHEQAVTAEEEEISNAFLVRNAF